MEYSTAAQAVSGQVSLNLSGTAWAYGAWVEVFASAAADLVLTGVSVGGGMNTTNVEFEIEIGRGAVGAEAVVARLRGFYHERSGINHGWVPLPIPTTGIVAGDRVAVRVRKSGTYTSLALKALVTYYAAPVGGAVTTTAAIATVIPTPGGAGASISAGGSPAYKPSAWSEMIASAAGPLALAVMAGTSGTTQHGRVEWGVGAAGAEAVIAQQSLFGGTIGYGVETVPYVAGVAIAQGARLAARVLVQPTTAVTATVAGVVVAR